MGSFELFIFNGFKAFDSLWAIQILCHHLEGEVQKTTIDDKGEGGPSKDERW